MDFQAARYLVDGDVPAQAGNDHPTVTPMGVVATKDGHINLGVGGDGQWRALCEAMGQSEWSKNPAYATMDDRTTCREEIWALLRPRFAQKTNAEWIAILDEYGVPAGPINPQVEHLGMAQPVTHPARGEVHLVAQPIDLSRTPAAIATPSPDAGEHTDEVLAEFGIPADRIATLRAAGAI